MNRPLLFPAVFLTMLFVFGLPSVLVSAATPSGDAVLEQQAKAAFDRQAYPQAKILYEQLAAQRQKQLGTIHPKTLVARREIAKCIRGQGDYKQAMKMLTEVGETQEKTLGVKHRDTLKTLAEIGSTFHYQGQYKNMLSLLQNVLTMQKSVLGETDKDTLETISSIAACLFAMGDGGSAKKMWESLLPITRKSLGENDKLTLWTRVNIAVATSSMGDPKRAIPMYLEVLPVAKRELGETHMLTLNIYQNLSIAYLRAGDRQKSKEIDAELRRVKKNLLGDDHPDTLVTRYSAAVGLFSQGKRKEAVGELADVLQRQRRVLGETHEHTLRTSSNLAAALVGLGEYKQAKAILQVTVEALKKEMGEEHPLTFNAMDNMAQVLYYQGDFKDAYAIQTKILPLYERVHGPKHPDTLKLRADMALVEEKLGNGAASQQQSQKTLVDLEKSLGAEHPTTLAARQNHAMILADAGKRKEAAGMLDEVFRARKKILGSDHLNTLETGINVAWLHGENGNFAEAESLLRDILPRLERTVGKNHPSTQAARNIFAQLQGGKGDYASALKQQRALLEEKTQSLGPDHPDTVTVLTGLGVTYLALGDLENALKIQTQAVETATRALGRDSEEALTARSNLAAVHSAMGQEAKAQALLAEVAKARQGKPGQPPSSALNTRKQQAVVLADAGKLKDARKILAGILEEETRTLGKFHMDTLRTLNLLSLVQTREGDFADAEKTLIAYAGRLSLSLEKDNPLFAPLFASLAGVAAKEKKDDAAVFFGKVFILAAQAQRERVTGLDRDLQQVHHARGESAYHLAIMILLEQGRTQEALAVLNFMKEAELDDKSRETLDMDQVAKDFLSSAEQALYQGYSIRMDNLRAFGQEWKALQLRSGSLSGEEKKKLKTLEARLEKDTEELCSFLNNIQKELHKRKKEADTSRTASANLRLLQDIARRMDGGSVFVHTAMGTWGDLWLFVTSPSGLAVRSFRMPQKNLNAAVAEFHAALTNPASDPRPAGKKLYDAIIAPIVKDLDAAGAKTLMFSLDGALRYIPMGALYDGKQWLAEKYDIAIFTEAARKSMQQPSTGGGIVAAMGVTKALGGFSALPAVAGEINGIVKTRDSAGVLPGNKYLDKQFTRKTLADNLKKGVPLVHVASHFQFEPTDQKASFLLLGDGKKLTMGEMFGQKGLSFDKVDLLTLSACDTASGVKKGDGREVESFGAMAQRHGAKAVLASLWPVADASTAVFMQEFYALRGMDKMNKAASLAETQRAMAQGRLTHTSSGSARSQRGKVSVAAPDAGTKAGKAPADWSHPYFWAPFILMGNWE